MRTVYHFISNDTARSISDCSNGIRVGPPAKTAATRINSSSGADDLRASGPVKLEPEPAFKPDRDDGSSNAHVKPAILLIYSRQFLRDCFARCLQAAYGDHDVFSFGSILGWRSSAEALARTPSVAIIVIESAHGSSLAELESFDDAPEKVPVIVISDIEDADQIVRTMRSGVRGYIPTNLPFSIAVEAVRLVGAGGVFVPASSFVHRRQPPAPAKSGVTLTRRETSVAEEIRRGEANKQIAHDLNISEHTVKLHVRHIMKKLKARNRTEVAILSRNVAASWKG